MTEKTSLGLFFFPDTYLPNKLCHGASRSKLPTYCPSTENKTISKKSGIPVPFPIRALYGNVAGTSGVTKEFSYRTTLTFRTTRELGTAIISF